MYIVFNRYLVREEYMYIYVINDTNDFRFQIRTDEGLKKAKSGPDGASRISEMSSINQKLVVQARTEGRIQNPSKIPPFVLLFFSSSSF